MPKREQQDSPNFGGNSAIEGNLCRDLVCKVHKAVYPVTTHPGHEIAE